MDAVFVLVRPRRAANVGAACRALKNMGQAQLRLVGAEVDAADPAVRALAYGAWDVLDGCARLAALQEAVGDCHLVVGTSGREPGAQAPRALAERLAPRPGRVAFVFGPESSGLTGDELRLCHERVRIPSDEAQPSLNLAQAVLVVAYEMRLAALAHGGGVIAGDPPAAVSEVEAALADGERALTAIGYLGPQSPGRILGELRALLARAEPTTRELALLRGAARQVAWAASRIARPAAAADNDGPPEGGAP